MENQMTFNEAMFALANGPQTAWLYWMSFAIIVTPLVLVTAKATRRDALIVLLTNIAMLVGMGWLYEVIGYVRLMGIVHIILWTPLFIYLFLRAKNGEMPLRCRVVTWMFVATLAVSLVFDYTDFARYVLGERAPMI